MELSSLKLKYNDLHKAIGGVVVDNGRFWKIRSINDTEFYAKSERDSFRGYNKYLQPYGKNGTINQYDGVKPFFKYTEGKLRKDTPKEVSDGTPFEQIDTTTILGLRKANLTKSIVQLAPNSKNGGFVIHDNGSEVIVLLKDGSRKTVDKDYLHYNKLHYTKNNYKRLWFVYDEKKSLTYDKPKPSLKGDAFKEYVQLHSQFDTQYQMSDDYRVYAIQSKIQKRMTELWGQLTPRQKVKIGKLK